jgi:hypothetical protein
MILKLKKLIYNTIRTKRLYGPEARLRSPFKLYEDSANAHSI